MEDEGDEEDDGEDEVVGMVEVMDVELEVSVLASSLREMLGGFANHMQAAKPQKLRHTVCLHQSKHRLVM